MPADSLAADVRHFESVAPGLRAGRVGTLTALPGPQLHLARYVANMDLARLPPLEFPVLAVHLGGNRVSGTTGSAVDSMPGASTLIPAGWVGEWHFQGAIDVAVVLFGSAARQQILAATAGLTQPIAYFDPLIPVLVRQLAAESNRNDRQSSHCDALAAALLAQLGILLKRGRIDPTDHKTGHGRYVQHAIDRIRRSPGEAWPISRLAAEVGLHPSWFRQLFRQVTGTTVHRYVAGQRLERVRELLVNTDLPLSRLAEETGFSSQSHLAASFRRAYGEPPSRFRRRR